MSEIHTGEPPGDRAAGGLSLVLAVMWIPVVAATVVALPSLDLMLETYTSFSMLRYVGMGQQIGPNKIRFMFFALAACATLALMSCFALGWKRSRAAAAMFGVLCGSLLLSLYSLLAFPLHFWPIIERLEIVNLPSVNYDEIFSKQPLIKANIDSPEKLYEFCHDQFKERKEYLQRVWGIQDQKKLEALFYLNLVSHLWGLGNADPHSNSSGCVANNEEIGFRTVEAPSIRFYLESNIGCCSDHAYILKMLLDRAGIPNRRVVTWVHVFNEARFSDGWLTLDATTAMVFHGDWEAIQRKLGADSRPVTVTIFPHQNLVKRDNPYYRIGAGHFRMLWLLSVAGRVVPALSYPDGRVK